MEIYIGMYNVTEIIVFVLAAFAVLFCAFILSCVFGFNKKGKRSAIAFGICILFAVKVIRAITNIVDDGIMYDGYGAALFEILAFSIILGGYKKAIKG